MADKIFEPKAIAVAQVDTVQVTGFDAATTYRLTVNGVIVASAVGNADVNTTASDLSTAWNAATHIYATGITASVATDTVTLTADTAEVPFTVTSSVSGGAGTIGAVTSSTAPTGPHTLNEAVNWSGEALPINNDRLIFPTVSANVVWGLDQLTTTGHTVIVPQGFDGIIGLDPDTFATSADGETTDSTATEYRATDLELDIATLEIGSHEGPGNPGGSRRIRINNDRAGASQTNILNTNGSGFSSGEPPVLLKMANASADINVQSGIVGIAIGLGETTTIGDIIIQDGQVYVGDGTTISGTVTQFLGAAELVLTVATLSAATIHGGQMTVRGDQALTTLTVWDGDVFPQSTGTITTLNARGGTTRFSRSGEARTLTTLNLFAGRGARVVYDPGVLTVTNDISPDSGERVDITRT